VGRVEKSVRRPSKCGRAIFGQRHVASARITRHLAANPQIGSGPVLPRAVEAEAASANGGQVGPRSRAIVKTWGCARILAASFDGKLTVAPGLELRSACSGRKEADRGEEDASCRGSNAP
jgi:hypothetical protein